MAGCPLRPTHVFILQEHPLSPGVLDDRDEAGDDHAAEEDDEDAADVGQTHLRARRRRRLRWKEKERELINLRADVGGDVGVGRDVRDGHQEGKLRWLRMSKPRVLELGWRKA